MPNPFAQAVGRATQSENLIDLTQTNPARFCGPTTDLLKLANRYRPDPRGMLTARQGIARYYANRGCRVDPDHIVLCSGTSEAYLWLFQLLADPGDTVLIPEPGYPLIPILAQLAGIQTMSYPIRCDGRFYYSASEVISSFTPRTKALVLVNPNNPTGNFLRSDQVPALLGYCADEEIPIISDEVFSDYLFDWESQWGPPRVTSVLQLPTPHQDVPVVRFVLSGFSKVLALPQLKLSWIVIAGPEPLRTIVQERLELIADMFLSVSDPVQAAASTLLQSRHDHTLALHLNLSRSLVQAEKALRHSSVTLIPPEGGFLAVLRLPKIMEELAMYERIIEECQVIVQPGSLYDFAEDHFYAVVSLLTDPHDIYRGLFRLGAWCDSF